MDPFCGPIWPFLGPSWHLWGPSGALSGSPGPPGSPLGPPTGRVGPPKGSTCRLLGLLGLFLAFRGTTLAALGALRSGLGALKGHFLGSWACPGVVFGISKARFFRVGTDFSIDSAPRTVDPSTLEPFSPTAFSNQPSSFNPIKSLQPR